MRKMKSMVIISFLCMINSYAVEVYFSPGDKVQKKLIAKIRQEKRGIKGAIYYFSDKEIATELGKAHEERGIPVEIVLDQNTLDVSWGKASLLDSYKIPVYVYDGGEKSIMHHKFFIFEDNGDDGPLVWTGSYNPTRKADSFNHENVVVLDDKNSVMRFKEEFERLKKISARYDVQKPANSVVGSAYFKSTIIIKPSIHEKIARKL